MPPDKERAPGGWSFGEAKMMPYVPRPLSPEMLEQVVQAYAMLNPKRRSPCQR